MINLYFPNFSSLWANRLDLYLLKISCPSSRAPLCQIKVQVFKEGHNHQINYLCIWKYHCYFWFGPKFLDLSKTIWTCPKWFWTYRRTSQKIIYYRDSWSTKYEEIKSETPNTLLIEKIINLKNARAWVSMVFT